MGKFEKFSWNYFDPVWGVILNLNWPKYLIQKFLRIRPTSKKCFFPVHDRLKFLFKGSRLVLLQFFCCCLSSYSLMLYMFLTPFIFVLSFFYLNFMILFFIRTSKILIRLEVLSFWRSSASKCSYFVVIFYETLFYSANQWTGFYIIVISVIKELRSFLCFCSW